MAKTKTRLSESYFFNSAVYYLQRYASTEANLHRVLQRKILRAKQRGEDIPPDTTEWINKAVTKCVTLGYVNDRFYAESKITSMRREGRSLLFIQQNLRQKGVSRDLVTELLQNKDTAEDAPDQEMEAALRTIRRRNLARRDSAHLPDETRKELYQKNLAKLLRSGFPLHTAKAALDQAWQKITDPDHDEDVL